MKTSFIITWIIFYLILGWCIYAGIMQVYLKILENISIIY